MGGTSAGVGTSQQETGGIQRQTHLRSVHTHHPIVNTHMQLTHTCWVTYLVASGNIQCMNTHTQSPLCASFLLPTRPEGLTLSLAASGLQVPLVPQLSGLHVPRVLGSQFSVETQEGQPRLSSTPTLSPSEALLEAPTALQVLILHVPEKGGQTKAMHP